MKSIERRLARLESTARPPGGGVVTYALGEAPADALSRARAAGVTGGVLLVPEVLTPETWAPLALAQQEALLSDISEHLPRQKKLVSPLGR